VGVWEVLVEFFWRGRPRFLVLGLYEGAFLVVGRAVLHGLVVDEALLQLVDRIGPWRTESW
jgi:hypothetical protein